MTEAEFPEELGAYDSAGKYLGEVDRCEVQPDPFPHTLQSAKSYVPKREEWGPGYT